MKLKFSAFFSSVSFFLNRSAATLQYKTFIVSFPQLFLVTIVFYPLTIFSKTNTCYKKQKKKKLYILSSSSISTVSWSSHSRISYAGFREQTKILHYNRKVESPVNSPPLPLRLFLVPGYRRNTISLPLKLNAIQYNSSRLHYESIISVKFDNLGGDISKYESTRINI